jgi:proline dehydrogenase
MKLVRLHGKEHARAKQKGYPTPICASKEATDDAIMMTVDYMIDHLDGISLRYS